MYNMSYCGREYIDDIPYDVYYNDVTDQMVYIRVG